MLFRLNQFISVNNADVKLHTRVYRHPCRRLVHASGGVRLGRGGTSSILIALHFNILRPFVLECKLLLDNWEEIVNHLKEHGCRSFLKVEIQNVNVSAGLLFASRSPSRAQRLSWGVHILGSWWSSLLLLLRRRVVIFNKFVYVDVKFEELLSDEVLYKFIIIY